MGGSMRASAAGTAMRGMRDGTQRGAQLPRRDAPEAAGAKPHFLIQHVKASTARSAYHETCVWPAGKRVAFFSRQAACLPSHPWFIRLTLDPIIGVLWFGLS